MTFHRVAVLAPGDMGHAIGRMMVEGGLRVVTCLAGRSDRTRALAGKAGIEDLGSLESVLDTAEVVMSVLPPSRSIETLEALAERPPKVRRAAPTSGTSTRSRRRRPGGGRRSWPPGLIFIDGGIIGGPPHPGRGSPRLYASGEEAPEMMRLVGTGLDVPGMEGRDRRRLGHQDVLCEPDEGADRHRDPVVHRRRPERCRGGIDRRDGIEPERPSVVCGALRAQHAAEGLPLGRGDGGDRRHVRGGGL